MLAFIVNQFPRQVDAYFLRELRGLGQRGLPFTIYSLLPAPRGWKVHEDAEALVARTVYAPPPSGLARSGARWLTRRPWAVGAHLLETTRGHRRSPTALAKSLAIVPQSMAFAEDMQRRGVRHIHANWATYPTSAARLISRLTGIPYSFSGHATDIFVRPTMLREKIESARFVVTCTGYNRGYLAGFAPAHTEKIHTVYHGVDLERFHPNGTAAHPGRILSVGTLRACKGLDDLIRAVGLLRGEGRDVDLEIVGEGEERPALEALIRELGLVDRVRLAGYRPQEHLLHAYRQAAVVALPAHHEDHFGIPNILIEALAAGAPVVCTELPSLPELVEHEKSGLFVPERDPRALAVAMARLLDEPWLARRLADEGRRRVAERFNMSQTVDQLARLLGDAVERAAA